MLREGAAKLKALLQAQQSTMRVVVPLRTGKGCRDDLQLRGVSAAALSERSWRKNGGQGRD